MAMLWPLKGEVAPVMAVGGKAASLMKLHSHPPLSASVPGGFALSVSFFEPWCQQITPTELYQACAQGDAESSSYTELKEMASSFPCTDEQNQSIQTISSAMASWAAGLCAVRSSAPEEDGAGASYAGVFETKLGVTAKGLESAIRQCFSSAFDQRVFSYARSNSTHRLSEGPRFASVVMEMVNSRVAGVAFSANPETGDLDEVAIDSSYGLGESVVDGSVVPDHFIVDKVHSKIVDKTIGSKASARWLGTDGGVTQADVDLKKQKECSLKDEIIVKLSSLVQSVEDLYGLPMDTEWALDGEGRLVLLQARPITTLYPLPEKMRTAPGQRRVLYLDGCLVDGPTTNEPLAGLDLDILASFAVEAMRPFGGIEFEMTDDPKKLMFCQGTRMYCNLSHVMSIPFVTPKVFASNLATMDPYGAQAFLSVDRQKYRSKPPPSELSCCSILSFICSKIGPLMRMKSTGKMYKTQPEEAVKERYSPALKEFRRQFDELRAKGRTGTFKEYFGSLWGVYEKLFMEDMYAIMAFMGDFEQLNKQLNANKAGSKKWQEAEILLGGFPGEEVVEMSKSMYVLANLIPDSVWSEYKGRTGELAVRITQNAAGAAQDLPEAFVSKWSEFVARWGCRGTSELCTSSKRYGDSPELLVAQLAGFAHESSKDPAIKQKKAIDERRALEKKLAGACGGLCSGGVKKRAARTEHLSGLRDNCKLRIVEIIYEMRRAVLEAARSLVEQGRLDSCEDVFQLSCDELDRAMKDTSFDLRAAIAPRMLYWEKAKRVKMWPLIFDSRGRLLKPPPPKAEKGVLVGQPISPGVATGKVRVMKSAHDPIEHGEILVAVVTDPGWTPLFVGASAVIMQIGGVLQHGGLVAREYGKPCVSGIPVLEVLKTGMYVEVDGNKGTVKVLEGPVRTSSRVRFADAPLLGSPLSSVFRSSSRILG